MSNGALPKSAVMATARSQVFAIIAAKQPPFPSRGGRRDGQEITADGALRFHARGACIHALAAVAAALVGVALSTTSSLPSQPLSTCFRSREQWTRQAFSSGAAHGVNQRWASGLKPFPRRARRDDEDNGVRAEKAGPDGQELAGAIDGTSESSSRLLKIDGSMVWSAGAGALDGGGRQRRPGLVDGLGQHQGWATGMTSH